MNKTGLFLILSVPLSVSAQDQAIRNLQLESGNAITKVPTDTSRKKWKAGGTYRLNIGQSSLSNWAAGGDEFSFNINTTLNLYARHKRKRFNWDNSLDLAFGFMQSSSLGSRKNDDRIDFVTKQSYSINKKTTVGTLINFRSQMTNGYTYDVKTNAKTFASGFMSPGYALASLGIDHKPTKELSLFLSPVTSRWVIVLDDTLASRGAYGVDSGYNSINELGAFATINFQKEVAKNLTYKSRLDMFSNYRKNPLNVDIYMTNLLAVKVFKMLSFSWSVDLIYDDDTRIFGTNKTSPALQFKSIVGAGLQVKI